MERKPLTVLWFGGGQDSTALLYMYKNNYKDFVHKYVGDGCHFIVVFSDTGNEYPQTYNHIQSIKVFCELYDIEFYHLKPHMGYHPKTWKSLGYQMRRNNTVFGVGFPKSCTDNLKIKPCYNFLESYLKSRYGYSSKKRKQVFYEYRKEFGRLKSIIGFAKGEEGRCAEPSQLELFPETIKDKRPKYMRDCVKHIYPLIEMKMNRQDCQDYIDSNHLNIPIPSNCMMCPFQNEAEIVYLERFHKDNFDEWVRLEQNKLQKDRDKPRNLGVKGKLSLSEYLVKAQSKYGYWTDEQLRDYRNSHGHCVKSKY